MAIHVVARDQVNWIPPDIYRLLTEGYWFSLAAGVLGTIGGLLARRRSASRSATTFVISLGLGVILLAIWTWDTALPRHILSGERFPMQVDVPRR